MKRILIFMIIILVLFMLTTIVLTQGKQAAEEGDIPTIINYQGFLTDQNGVALTGSYQIRFSIYAEASGPNPWLWQETHAAVNVEGGLFNVLLGSVDTLTAEELNGERYLGIKVGGEIEMTPRLQIASSAFSLRAEEANNASTLDNMNSDEFVAVAGDTMTGALTLDGGDFNTSGKVKEKGNDLLPRGVIVMWSGTLDSIPAGWTICDGDSGTPDLRNKFVYGVDDGQNPGLTGGTDEHSHTTNIGTITTTQYNGTYAYAAIPASGTITLSHTHNVQIGTKTSNTVNHLPPYYKLAFIMKL